MARAAVNLKINSSDIIVDQHSIWHADHGTTAGIRRSFHSGRWSVGELTSMVWLESATSLWAEAKVRFGQSSAEKREVL